MCSVTTMDKWTPVSEQEPPQRRLVKVTGDSGSVRYIKFLTLAYLDDDYRPRHGGQPRWLDVTHTALSDYGFAPMHWAPFDLGELP